MIQPVLKNTYCTSILHVYCQNNSLVLYVSGGKDTFYTKGCMQTELLDGIMSSEESVLLLNDSLDKEITCLKMVLVKD